ncbi:MAG: peptidoglycan editing factor PgeF [Gammaproteobacteria bacterium]|nr:MAG: peptidoglycan editing factor PgeF [Gammaproteobacteria bacterium]
MSLPVEFIAAGWDVPSHVHGLVTLKTGGYSKGVYQGLNLATHVGDDEQLVLKNRELLREQLALPRQPHWLNQTHSTEVIHLPLKTTVDADGAWTSQANIVCAVMTADCLPLFFYHPIEHKVAVIHAGWRGLANGIIEKAIQQITDNPEKLKVWLGPAIGPDVFEVGEEVKDIFCAKDPVANDCFKLSLKESASNKKHYFADIYRLARQRLYNSGVTEISGGNFCTMTDKERFFSYRRDGETGRMASLIWISK